MLLLNLNRKLYTGSPVAPSDVTLDSFEISRSLVYQVVGNLYHVYVTYISC